MTEVNCSLFTVVEAQMLTEKEERRGHENGDEEREKQMEGKMDTSWHQEQNNSEKMSSITSWFLEAEKQYF